MSKARRHTIPPLDILKRQFQFQQSNAKRRGIGFLLTFEQWLKIWTDSSHLHERGCHRGKYNMARYGDRGAYEVGNVRIIPHGDNIAERDQTSRIAKHRLAMMGHEVSAETRAKISAAKMGHPGYFLGGKHTSEARAKISAARKAYWAARKGGARG